MFESLSEKLGGLFKRLGKGGRITEESLKEVLREIRIALLDADVNVKVVKTFVERVQEQAVGQEVLKSLTPDQQFVKIINDELARVLGEHHAPLKLATDGGPTVIMMVGLQGSGKTTTTGKLATHLKKQGRTVAVAALDVYRPAAVEQLQRVAEQVGVPCLAYGTERKPTDLLPEVLKDAKAAGASVILLDTAGRLQVDEAMMEELVALKAIHPPTEILLVVDAMMGQQAVEVAQSFDERLNLTGVILSKMEGDTRGGAALSIAEMVGKPIKFVGVGEKLDQLEPFHPDRVAGRILGMGDVVSLVERVQEQLDEDEVLKMQERTLAKDFNLEDFLDQMRQMKRLGPLENVLKMIPGVEKMMQGGMPQIDDRDLTRTEAIILSMTKRERRDPDLLDGSRRRRIAKGSGTSVQDVNQLLKQFKESKRMIHQMVGRQQGPKLSSKAKQKLKKKKRKKGR